MFIIIIIAHEKTKTIDEEDMLRKTENDRVEYSTPIYIVLSLSIKKRKANQSIELVDDPSDSLANRW